MVGLYIDALSDEQRDRIIEAKDFYDGRGGYFHDGCGCLVGVAEMKSNIGLCPVNFLMGAQFDWEALPSSSFPSLCERFGKDRIVAACKARAARGNAPTLTEVRSKVYEGLVPVGGMNGWVRDLR